MTVWKWVCKRGTHIAYVIVVIGLAVAVTVAYGANQRSHRADQRDITRNCITGQRAWETLDRVVHTAYETRSLQVDPKTLPPETQRLLAALAPLLKASSGKGNTTEQKVLDQLGPRPTC